MTVVAKVSQDGFRFDHQINLIPVSCVSCSAFFLSSVMVSLFPETKQG